MTTMKTTKKINKLNRKLKFSEVLFSCMLILMVLGLLGAIVSTFIWVWIGWALAWKIGLTGLLTFFLSGVGWAITYNLTKSTINHINNFRDEYGAGKTHKAWDKAMDDYFKSKKQKQDGHH